MNGAVAPVGPHKPLKRGMLTCLSGKAWQRWIPSARCVTRPHLSRRRTCIDQIRGRLSVSERRACRLSDQHRSTLRHRSRGRVDEKRLVADMIELAKQYGRYGHRRIAVLLRDAGWQIRDGWVDRHPPWASD